MSDHDQWKERGERAEMAAAELGQGAKALSWIWKIELNFEGETIDGLTGAVQEWTDEGK